MYDVGYYTEIVIYIFKNVCVCVCVCIKTAYMICMNVCMHVCMYFLSINRLGWVIYTSLHFEILHAAIRQKKKFLTQFSRCVSEIFFHGKFATLFG